MRNCHCEEQAKSLRRGNPLPSAIGYIELPEMKEKESCYAEENESAE